MSAGKTITFTATNAGFTAIVAQVPTRRVMVSEAPGGQLTDFLIAQPTVADTPLTYYPGFSVSFERPGGYYQAGEVVAHIKLVTAASTTIQQMESGL